MQNYALGRGFQDSGVLVGPTQVILECMHSHLLPSLHFHGLWPTKLPWSMGFFRQEYWSGLAFPSPADLPDPGIELVSPALQADSLPALMAAYTVILAILLLSSIPQSPAEGPLLP